MNAPTQGQEAVVCLVTAPPDDAGSIATAMLDRKLGACVNIVEGARSLYRWEGKLQDEREALLIVVRRGPLGLAEVAEIERVNPTMLSRIVAELCDAGLISREPDPEDRRAARVRATAAGQRMRKRIHRERANALQRHVATLDARQRRALRDSLPVLEALAERIPRTSR